MSECRVRDPNKKKEVERLNAMATLLTDNFHDNDFHIHGAVAAYVAACPMGVLAASLVRTLQRYHLMRTKNSAFYSRKRGSETYKA